MTDKKATGASVKTSLLWAFFCGVVFARGCDLMMAQMGIHASYPFVASKPSAPHNQETGR